MNNLEDLEFNDFINKLMIKGDLEIIRNKEIIESLSKDENNFNEESFI